MDANVFSFKQNRLIDFLRVEQSLQAAYRSAHEQYRRDDELEVQTRHHQRLALILEQISSSFRKPIAVLDVGCGTGRYFHCLKNVQRLVGVDLSPEMLQAAKNPVLRDEISADHIELIQGNSHVLSFAPESFDFIYSLGMFGHGCPVTVELCNKFFDWLRPEGVLFFSTLDAATLPVTTRIRRQLIPSLYPIVPSHWRDALQNRRAAVPFFGLTKSTLTAILQRSRFRNFTVSQNRARSPLWKGIHLECEALKAAE